MKNSSVPPWARGPLELLKHADGHLQSGGDTDRRIALIGFDQAIETSIEVYVRLHPRLRSGKELRHETVDRALRNFHTKIEFLETHLASEQRELGVTMEAIVWYHSLRNELYHSGNGMVPELHVIQGAREASIRVFAAIFGEECACELGQRVRVSPDDAVVPTEDPAMTFLSKFIELEKLLRSRIRTLRSPPVEVSLIFGGPLSELTQNPRRLRGGVHEVVNLRNRIVHEGADLLASESEIRKANNVLAQVVEAMRGIES